MFPSKLFLTFVTKLGFRLKKPPLRTDRIRCFASSVSRPKEKAAPSAERGDYVNVDESDVSYFESVLGTDSVIRDETVLERHNLDWTRSYRGRSQLLLRPRSVDEVAAILSHCNDRRLAVCPQGGNTGLVGGGVPVYDEIILSLALMNKVIHLNTSSGVVVCEAGCILETLDSFIGNEGLMVPLDLGARGSCQIGGNVATNAGGLRLLRYGSLHGNVLGLEVVLANGTIIDCLSTLRKDNAGYDIKQIFIGSEGTLGVITKVALQCATRSSSINLAFLACESFDAVYETYKVARSMLGEVISAFEMMDLESLKIVQHYYKLRSPIEPITRFPFYVLMETSGSNEKHDEEKVQLFVEHVLRDGCVKDGGLYSQSTQMRSLWQIRESISSATLKDGYVYKYDLSLPPKFLYNVVSDVRQRLEGKVSNVNGFGHIGDSNIHINVSTPEYDPRVHALLEPYIFEWVAQHNGSISAEHGVGQQKRDYIHLCRSEDTLKLMQSLKTHFDPKGILNPYKVVPQISCNN